jgi:sensor histidine kinase YesM
VYVEGIGLSNVRERLRVLYGTDFHLGINSHEGQGTKICIDVPQLVPVIPEVSVF